MTTSDSEITVVLREGCEIVDGEVKLNRVTRNEYEVRVETNSGILKNLTFHHVTKKPVKVRACRMTEPFSVWTMQGVKAGNAGDYLVLFDNGTLYPCDVDTFNKHYSV
jgi:hypothetical protein